MANNPMLREALIFLADRRLGFSALLRRGCGQFADPIMETVVQA
jgi:hypothetical protein